MRKAHGPRTPSGRTVSGQSWLALLLLALQVCVLPTLCQSLPSCHIRNRLLGPHLCCVFLQYLLPLLVSVMF